MCNGDMSGLTLGLDIGTNSVGWALVRKEGERNSSIVDMGVHIFPLSVEGDVASGRHETKNSMRRQKRLMRRQNDRRKRRMIRVMNILQEAGLLPKDKDMAQAIKTIDTTFLAKHGGHEIPVDILAHIVPYALRKRALDYGLEPYQLGRALYHLAQRRGFLSNRKILVSDEDGVVKAGISELKHDMAFAGARTLGEFFAGLNPEERRIRNHYTHRDMFKDEFRQIWEVQKTHTPEILTEELFKRLHNALFFQRSLKSQKHLIGACPFERDEKRCAWYRPEAQRFRVLQTVNHLRVVDGVGESRPLSGDERQALVAELYERESMSCAEARKLLGIKGKGIKFSIELDNAKKIKGDRTTAQLIEVFGKRWSQFSDKDREKIIHDLVSIETRDALERRGRGVWGLEGEKLELFSDLILEDEYAGLSLKAIRKIMPLLEEGLSYSEAVGKEYAAFSATDHVLSELPAFAEVCGDLRNPIVSRSLTYVRRVVNAVISKYGKPELIRIELARDIKQSKKEKARRTKEINDRTKEREKIRASIQNYDSRLEPTRDDIVKVQLWEECGGVCPYTGKPIGWEDLFGPQPKFDVEHIIPFAISLDDSFMNKTLCHHHENRHVKGRRSPFQAYGGDIENYAQILQRVETNFKGGCKAEKLRRFKLEDLSEFEDFSSRHLNDTRYASRQAMEYLSLLYGGLSDSLGIRRVQAVSGPITAIVRRWYGMTGLLGSGEKTREDHRHHAVDAVAIALTGAKTIESLSRASANMKDMSRLAFGQEAEPWKDFIPELKAKLAEVRAVHHQSKKVRGQLHEDTLYSRQENGTLHVRKKLTAMNSAEIGKIVDLAVRKAVLGRMEELGEKDPAKAFANEANLPVLKNGHVVKSARIVARAKNPVMIGSGMHQRAVVAGNNHHAEVVAVLNGHGDECKWEGFVVSMLEAYKRKNERLQQHCAPDVVKRSHGQGRLFKFSLSGGDCIEMDTSSGTREVFLIKGIAQDAGRNSFEIDAIKLNDARLKDVIKKSGCLVRKKTDALRKANVRKVWLTPFGELRYAND